MVAKLAPDFVTNRLDQFRRGCRLEIVHVAARDWRVHVVVAGGVPAVVVLAGRGSVVSRSGGGRRVQLLDPQLVVEMGTDPHTKCGVFRVLSSNNAETFDVVGVRICRSEQIPHQPVSARLQLQFERWDRAVVMKHSVSQL